MTSDMPETLYSLGKAALLDGDPASGREGLEEGDRTRGAKLACSSSALQLTNLYRKQGDKAYEQHEDTGIPETAGFGFKSSKPTVWKLNAR